jgi:hypothetical protein
MGHTTKVTLNSEIAESAKFERHVAMPIDCPLVTLIFGWNTFEDVDWCDLERLRRDMTIILEDEGMYGDALHQFTEYTYNELVKFQRENYAWVEARRECERLTFARQESVRELRIDLGTVAGCLVNAAKEIEAMGEIMTRNGLDHLSNGYSAELKTLGQAVLDRLHDGSLDYTSVDWQEVFDSLG